MAAIAHDNWLVTCPELTVQCCFIKAWVRGAVCMLKQHAPVRAGRLRGSMARFLKMLPAQQAWVKAHPIPGWGASTPSSLSHHQPYTQSAFFHMSSTNQQ